MRAHRKGKLFGRPSLLANLGQSLFQLLIPKQAFGESFAYKRKLFILLIEQVSAFRGDDLKLLRAFDCFARRLQFLFQLGHSTFEFFDPLCPFSRGIGSECGSWFPVFRFDRWTAAS